MNNRWSLSILLVTALMATATFEHDLDPSRAPASFGDPSGSRHERGERAKEAILKLNFFHKGLGMHVAPGLIPFLDAAENASRVVKRDMPQFRKRYGINHSDGELIGIYNERYEGMQIGVLGCVACHSGKAAGRFIVGIGNKNIDVGQIGKDAYNAQKAWKAMGWFTPDSEEKVRVRDSAIQFAKDLSDERLTNLTQGLVPTAVIRRWFYRQAGEDVPASMPRAAVKVPHLFGYAEKRKVGQFCDGGGDGNYPGWGIAVELAAGQRADHVQEYVHKIEHAENLLGDLLPPEYPFAIDHSRAKRGEQVFAKNCAGCHGTYERDEADLPVYKAPKLIPWKVVKTDRERLALIDDHFIELVAKSPLKDIIRSTPHREKYFAPRLHAVWARFPYLHNGSVPTIRDLLKPPAERPWLFDLEDAGEEENFDAENLGLKVRVPKKLKGRKRSYFDTTLDGQSNAGHDFHTDLPDADKDDLIEYLKTL